MHGTIRWMAGICPDPEHENETSHPVAGWGVFSVSGLRFLFFYSMICHIGGDTENKKQS